MENKSSERFSLSRHDKRARLIQQTKRVLKQFTPLWLLSAQTSSVRCWYSVDKGITTSSCCSVQRGTAHTNRMNHVKFTAKTKVNVHKICTFLGLPLVQLFFHFAEFVLEQLNVWTLKIWWFKCYKTLSESVREDPGSRRSSFLSHGLLLWRSWWKLRLTLSCGSCQEDSADVMMDHWVFVVLSIVSAETLLGPSWRRRRGRGLDWAEGGLYGWEMM